MYGAVLFAASLWFLCSEASNDVCPVRHARGLSVNGRRERAKYAAAQKDEGKKAYVNLCVGLFWPESIRIYMSHSFCLSKKCWPGHSFAWPRIFVLWQKNRCVHVWLRCHVMRNERMSSLSLPVLVLELALSCIPFPLNWGLAMRRFKMACRIGAGLADWT